MHVHLRRTAGGGSRESKAGVLLNVTIVSPPDRPTSAYVLLLPGDSPSAPLASTLNPVTPIAFNFQAPRTMSKGASRPP